MLGTDLHQLFIAKIILWRHFMNKLRFLIMTVLLILVFAGCEQSAKTRSPDSPGQTEIMKKRKFIFKKVT